MRYNPEHDEYIPDPDDSDYMVYMPGHVEYDRLMDYENVFYPSVLDMFATESFVPADKLIMQLYKMFKVDMYPSLFELVDFTGLSVGSKKNMRSAFYGTGYASKTTRKFNDYFRITYFRTALKHWKDCTETADSVTESEFLNEVRAGKTLPYEHAIRAIKSCNRVEFLIPDNVVPSTCLDKISPHVQYAVISNHGAGSQMPHIITYGFVCPRCKMVTHPLYNGTGKFCGCGGRLIPYPEQDHAVNVHVYSLSVGEMDTTVLSLKELPVGDSLVAMYMLREHTRNRYYGFVLSVVKRDMIADALDLGEDKRHAMFPIIEYIDQRILAADNQVVSDLQVPKASLIMSMFKNIRGDTTLNCMFAGEAGTNKTRLMKYVLPVMSRTARLQDVINTSIPGVMGTGKQNTINGQVVDSIQRGLYTTVEALIFDELYSRKSLYKECKTVMLQDVVPKHVANATFRTPKTATTYGTANVDKSQLKERNNRLRELERWARLDPFRFRGLSSYAEDLISSDCFNTLTDSDYKRIAKCVYIEECITYETNYIDGFEIAESDRFPFLFYFKKGSNQTSVYRESSAKGMELNDLLYSPSLRGYLEKCAGIKFKISDDMVSLIDNVVVKEAALYNFCQSVERISITAQKVAEMSAALNGRYCVNEIDVLFVRDMMRCMGREISVDELNFPPYWSRGLTVDDAIEYLNLPLSPDVFTCTFKVSEEKIPKPPVPEPVHELPPTCPEVEYKTFVPKDKTRPVPFTEAPEDSTPSGITGYLIKWFTECGYITNKDLEYLSEQHNVESRRIKLAVGSMCDGGLVAKDERVSGYRIC